MLLGPHLLISDLGILSQTMG